MTDIDVPQYSSFTISVRAESVDNTDPQNPVVTPIDLTDALLLFFMRKLGAQGWDNYVARKTSNDADEIEVTDAVNGLAQIKVGGEDTRGAVGDYPWFVYLVRRGSALAAAASAEVSAGASDIVLSSVSAEDWPDRHLLEISGVNQVKTLGDVVDASTVRADLSDLDADPGATVDAYVADIKQPTSLCGRIRLRPCAG